MKLVIGLILLTCGSVSMARDLCVTQQVDNMITGGSFRASEIYCQDGGQYETQRNITGILIPLPYNWEKAAFERMDTMMTSAGFENLTALKPAVGHSYYIYDLKSSLKTKNFCLVIEDTTQGGSSRQLVCNDDAIRLNSSGAEITQYLNDKGYKKEFSFRRLNFEPGSATASPNEYMELFSK